MFFLLTEKGFRKHQCPFGFGYEIRQILLGLQTNVENVAPRQSQIDHHCQQYTTAKVNGYIRLLRSSVFFHAMWKKFTNRYLDDSIWNHMELRFCDWEVCFQCNRTISSTCNRKRLIVWSYKDAWLHVKNCLKAKKNYTKKTYGVVIRISYRRENFIAASSFIWF